MKKLFAVMIAALLLGAPYANAQLKLPKQEFQKEGPVTPKATLRTQPPSLYLQVPAPASELHGHPSCLVEGVTLQNEASCLVVKALLKGRSLPFGPTFGIMSDIDFVCEHGLGGFMDYRFQGGRTETREYHFLTSDGFACFKAKNARGEEQETGPWTDEVRELQLSTAVRPKSVAGSSASINGNGRREAVVPQEFRTTSIRVETRKRQP